jgi:hypothetical protein
MATGEAGLNECPMNIRMLKRLDPTLAQRILTKYVDKTGTSIASATGTFMDANDFFDKAGVDRIYRR